MAKKKGRISKLFKKMNGTSNLEVSFSKILDDLGLRYIHHYVFKGREYDFLLVDYNLLVETHGCFFHCCKLHNPEAKYTFQKNNLVNDKKKALAAKFNKTYKLLVVWEHEMKDIQLLTEKLTKLI
jgi:G:T-mismatch repair DNA endonuclease (very short patch repair protein)